MTAYAQHLTSRWASGNAPPPPNRVRPHRFLPSTRQSIVESRNNQLNDNINLKAKLVLVYMEEVLHILDRTNSHEKGAVQALMSQAMQAGLDGLLRVWDLHPVRTAHRTKGVPWKLREERRYPGVRVPLPANFDMVTSYEAANRKVLRREPTWAAARDPLYGQPARRAARAQAVMALWGSALRAWADIEHNTGRGVFIPSYLLYLSFR